VEPQIDVVAPFVDFAPLVEVDPNRNNVFLDVVEVVPEHMITLDNSNDYCC
jgi:hypothetical protein